mgnify:CR=1 FL=1
MSHGANTAIAVAIGVLVFALLAILRRSMTWKLSYGRRFPVCAGCFLNRMSVTDRFKPLPLGLRSPGLKRYTFDTK